MNTGSVVGYGSNIFGTGFHDKYLPPFSWGSPGDYTKFKLDKFINTAESMMSRRSIKLTTDEKDIISNLYDHSMKKVKQK